LFAAGKIGVVVRLRGWIGGNDNTTSKKQRKYGIWKIDADTIATFW